LGDFAAAGAARGTQLWLAFIPDKLMDVANLMCPWLGRIKLER